MTDSSISPGQNLVDRRLLRAARISFVVSVTILLIKFAAYYLTNSKAVLSDALESIVNVLGAIAAFAVMHKVSHPADEEHPYGHGKLEYFSAAFEGGLVAFASVLIAWEAVAALINRSPLFNIDEGIWLIGASGLMNLGLGLYLRWEGDRHKSHAISASGNHVLADVATTAAALLGLVLFLFTGAWWIDGSVALLISGYLGFTGYSIVRQSMAGLLDERDSLVLNDLTAALEAKREKGLIEIHNLKVIRSGRFHHVDAHLVVPRFWSVLEAHEIIEQYEKDVVAHYPYDGEIAIHTDPCESRHCKSCELEDCKIRSSEFQKRKSFHSINVTRGPGHGENL